MHGHISLFTKKSHLTSYIWNQISPLPCLFSPQKKRRVCTCCFLILFFYPMPEADVLQHDHWIHQYAHNEVPYVTLRYVTLCPGEERAIADQTHQSPVIAWKNLRT